MNLIEYPPPRQPGLTIHAVLIAVSAAVCAAGAWLASRTEVNLAFTLYILLAVVGFFPLPFLIYWLYSLTRANYVLDRDKLTLSWGLRVEQIPVSDVDWVRSLHDLAAPLPLPVVRLPGSVLGTRRHPDLGLVEFLASDEKKLLLVATARRVFAISPADPVPFVSNFQRIIEMGSLAPAPAQSVYPVFVVVEAWENLTARYLWLAGLFVNVGLLTWVTLLIPALKWVPLSFQPSGIPAVPVPGVRLILLPILSILFFGLGWTAGLFFYRRPEYRPLAIIVWVSSVLASVLFLLAVMFIISTPI